MKILHNHGFSEEERDMQKGIVYNNVVESMFTILTGMKHLNIRFVDSSLERDAKIVFDEVKNRSEFETISEDLRYAIMNLWKDTAVNTTALERSNEYQLPDCASYFLNSIERISKTGYSPTEQDILLSRKQTTGIIEVKFTVKEKEFRVFDVGGQRSERKKWIHCFEGVQAIIYIVAISEFDQVLLEDATTNRLVESLRLFEAICNSSWFIKTSMILFLNKKDLFMEKIKKKSISVCFPEYKGPNSYDDQVKFLDTKFRSINENPEKEMYIHETCATDTNQAQLILNNTFDIILQKNMAKMGL
uniref:Uncharacterized protein n=1 Tax=Acrobeloides nanus TaxID=290746 RepID=A0A914E486_9BILA